MIHKIVEYVAYCPKCGADVGPRRSREVEAHGDMADHTREHADQLELLLEDL